MFHVMRVASFLALGAALVAAGCEPPVDLIVGDVLVSIVTTGGDLDLDGYRVFLDTVEVESVAVNDTISRSHIPAGVYVLELRGVAANCTVGDNPRPVHVVGGEATTMSFAVTCVGTGVRITTHTIGVDPDPDGFVVAVDGGMPIAIGLNGTATVTYLAPGAHSVMVSGNSANCTIAQPDRLVSLVMGQVAAESIDVTCHATTGVLQVSVVTTGFEKDPYAYDDYTVTLDGNGAVSIARNGAATITGVSAGDHLVDLVTGSGSCFVSSTSPLTVTVTAGGTTRDTTRTTFSVGCFPVTASWRR